MKFIAIAATRAICCPRRFANAGWIAFNLVFAFFAVSAGPANATLLDFGDFTTDTETGLDWLDLSETVGLSYNDVLGGAANQVLNRPTGLGQPAAGCRAERLAPKLVLQLSELLRLMEKLARVSGA